MAADALKELAFAALLALLSGRNTGFVRDHLFAGVVEIDGEAIPELLDRAAPGHLAFFDFVELVFQAGGEAHVENILEGFHKKVTDFFAEARGREAALVLVHVFALDDGRDDRGVGGRPADAFFFELFHERRFRVTRRRLGKMLLGADGFETQLLAFANLRQAIAGVVSASSSFSSSSFTAA